jgi:ArsR family transcriptional regulator
MVGVLAERRSRSQEFFAGAAERWDKVRDELFGRSAYFLALLELLDREMTVADLGCGTGAVAEALAPAVRRVVAVDGSDAMLEAARARLANTRNVKLRRGDLEDLPLREDSVDAATLILVLHHLSDPGTAVAEAARILRPGGRLLIVDMLPHDRIEYEQEMGHVWMGFGERKIRSILARCGFGEVRFHPLPPDPSARGPVLFAASAAVDARETVPAKSKATRKKANESQRSSGRVKPPEGRRFRK